MWYPWESSDALIAFIEDQIKRFGVPRPTSRAIDKIASYVVTYVAKTNYYPRSPDEAMSRYVEDPPRGLTEPERQALVPEIELYLKRDLREQITEAQLHICLWAALLFCWSEEGERDVQWVKKVELKEDYYPVRNLS